MRPEYFLKGNDQWSFTKGDQVEDLKSIYTGLFKVFDFAVPQLWLNDVMNYSGAKNLSYIYVYDPIERERRNGFGFPFPMDHLSRMVLELWSKHFNQDLFDVHADEKGWCWKLRESRSFQYENVIFEMLRQRKIDSKEAMIFLELIDTFGKDLKKNLKNRSYLLESFSQLFEDKNDC